MDTKRAEGTISCIKKKWEIYHLSCSFVVKVLYDLVVVILFEVQKGYY